MRLRTRNGGKALAALVAVAFVSGCSFNVNLSDVEPSESMSASESGAPGANPTPGSTASAAESPTPRAPRSTAVADPLPELTAPGTRLKMGETAILDADASAADETSRMVAEVTMTEIEEGDQAILDHIDDLGEYEGGTVHYVRGTVTPLAAADEGMDRVTWALWGVQDDGLTMATPMFAVEDLAGDCSDTWVLSEPRFGQPHEMCRIAIAMPGTKPAGVAFVRDADAIGSQPSEDPYIADPVLWLLD